MYTYIQISPNVSKYIQYIYIYIKIYHDIQNTKGPRRPARPRGYGLAGTGAGAGPGGAAPQPLGI